MNGSASGSGPSSARQAYPTEGRLLQRALLREAGLVDVLALTRGAPGISIAMVDGVVDRGHPTLNTATIVAVPSKGGEDAEHRGRAHATFIASMLVGRKPHALGICSDCRLVSIPAVTGDLLDGGVPRRAIAGRLAAGLTNAVDLGADVILLGVELTPSAGFDFSALTDAIAAAAQCGVRTVIPAGNTAGASDSPLLAAWGSVPVGLARHDGDPDPAGTWGAALGARGLLAPGRDIPGADLGGGIQIASGSSFSAAFVVAAFALLRSLAPRRCRSAIWDALLAPWPRYVDRSMRPPSLDADASASRILQTV